MGAARSRVVKWRTPKDRRRRQKRSRHWRASQSVPVDDAESARIEQTDRLLLSALRFWEVKRDLIDERMAAITSASASL